MHIKSMYAALAITAVAGVSFYAGFNLAPREVLDSTVEHVGFMTLDTKKVLSATVESLKSESRLVSYSFVGQQNVSIDREQWYIFRGNQQLIVPATVSYFLDMKQLDESRVLFDESTNTVTVLMPKLMLSVDIDPRRATIINSGVLSLSDSIVQALQKLNYDTARKSAIKQGQQAELVSLAKDRTRKNIERLFQVPLQVSGRAGVKIIAKFPDDGDLRSQR